MPQSWSEIESGVYGNEELSKNMRMIAPLRAKLLDAVEPGSEFNLGKKSGDKVAVRLVGRISTLATSPLSEFTKIPVSKQPEYEATATVYRRGFGINWTGTREDLDRLDVKNKNIETLRDHSARTHNQVISTAAAAGRSFTYCATTSSAYAFRTDGTVVATANANFSLFHARKLALEADRYNIPPADGEGYFFYATPTIRDNILLDTGTNGFVDIAKYDPSKVGGILNGEIGKVGNLRVVIDNTGAMDDSIGTGSAFGSGFIFGDEALKEVLGPYPVHFRANPNYGGDFGFQKAIAWASFLGYFSPWNYTAHGQGSIIHYTSA